MKVHVAAIVVASILGGALALGSISPVSADHDGTTGTHPPTTECPWDVNGDGSVDRTDALAVIQAFGTPSTLADVNSDGLVDYLDLQDVWEHLGACGTTGSTGSPPPGKPNIGWLLGVLDGSANEHNLDALANGHDLF